MGSPHLKPKYHFLVQCETNGCSIYSLTIHIIIPSCFRCKRMSAKATMASSTPINTRLFCLIINYLWYLILYQSHNRNTKKTNNHYIDATKKKSMIRTNLPGFVDKEPWKICEHFHQVKTHIASIQDTVCVYVFILKFFSIKSKSTQYFAWQ